MYNKMPVSFDIDSVNLDEVQRTTLHLHNQVCVCTRSAALHGAISRARRVVGSFIANARVNTRNERSRGARRMQPLTENFP